MKKNNIALSMAVLTVIAGVGLASATFASDKTTTNGQKFKSFYENKIARHSLENKIGTTTLNQIAKDARMAENNTKKVAVKAALEANDYDAWVIAVGPNSPLLTKINATNFNRLVEAYNLQVKADELELQTQNIMKELGINNGHQKGLGIGMGMGLHLGLNK